MDARHEAAGSNELLRVLVYDSALTIWRLVELGKLSIAQDGPLQPLGTLVQCLCPYCAELNLPQFHVE